MLEQLWNGSLLNSVDAVIKSARTMTSKGKHPVVELVTSIYQRGVQLTKQAMDTLETHLQRLPSLGKWFVDIAYLAPAIRDR
jgi:Rhodopirellula transposase DDE domain